MSRSVEYRHLILTCGSFALWQFLFTSPSWAHGENHSSKDPESTATEVQETPSQGGHHVMTHPFLVHMGLPDGPGEASVRVTHIQRAGALGTGTDAAIHIEAGVWDRFGIHLRNDAISGNAMGVPGEMREDHGTELMLMYGLIQDANGTRGISLFGQISVPTVRGDGPAVRGAFGFAGRYLWENRVLFDANIHLDPTEARLESEYEASLQYRVTGRVFALFEVNGSLGGNGHSRNYVLPALKLGLGKTGGAVGVGIQVPTTTERDFDRQALFQLDWAF